MVPQIRDIADCRSLLQIKKEIESYLGDVTGTCGREDHIPASALRALHLDQQKEG